MSGTNPGSNIVPAEGAAEALMQKHGWDKGTVFFGEPASESSVKVMTSLEHAKKFGGPTFTSVGLR